MVVQEFTTQELENEEWRPVVGWENDYEVSNLGRLRLACARKYLKLPKGHILKPRLQGRKGAMYFYLPLKSKKHRPVHALVAAAFLGERPSGLQINHKDGNRLNNRATNLEYVTQSENQQHAVRMGLRPTGDAHWARLHQDLLARGSEHRGAILNEADVRQIRLLYERRSKEFGAPALGKRFGVTNHTILAVINGRTWKHLR